MNNINHENYETKVDATIVYHSFRVHQPRIKKTKMIPWASLESIFSVFSNASIRHYWKQSLSSNEIAYLLLLLKMLVKGDC